MMLERNRPFDLAFPIIAGILFALLLSAIEHLIGISFNFFLLLIAFFIGNTMVKRLVEIRTSHKIIAAVYAVLVFIVNRITALVFFLSGSLSISALEALRYALTLDGVLLMIRGFDFFDYLILIVMPIIGYQYLNRKSPF